VTSATGRATGSETAELEVDPVALAALADLLGADDVDLSPGAAVPALWHWVALARWPTPASLGPDGHPRRGTGVVPDVALPRRMFGGGRLTLHRPLPVGATVRVTTTAGPPRPRTGRTGELVLVDLEVAVHDQHGTLLLEETRHLVFTGATQVDGQPPTPVALPAEPALLSTDQDQVRWLRTDPGLLARFSALTANPHRIHLDWPYTTTVEGYPGLVVHGPLQALVLAEVGRRAGDRPRRTLDHRGSAPLFCGEPARVEHDPASRVLQLLGDDGRPRARLRLDPDA